MQTDRKEEIRRRVARLLSGDRRTSDLQVIFLWLRANSHGRLAIRDVGDFVAHGDSRDHGLVYGRVCDMAAMFKLTISGHLVRAGRPIKPLSLDDIRWSLEASARLVSDEELKKMRLGRPELQRLLRRVLPKVTRLEDNRLHASALTSREEEVLELLIGRAVIECAFTDRSLIAEFGEVLEANALISGDWSAELEALKPFLALFAVQQAHLCEVVAKDGQRIRLEATNCQPPERPPGRRIAVRMEIPFPTHEHTQFFAVNVIYSDCLSEQHATPELAAIPDGRPWSGPIELTDGALLRSL